MGLDDADDDIHLVGLLLARREQHCVGLANAGRGAEEDFQPAALLGFLVALNASEQRIGVGAVRVGGHDLKGLPCRRLWQVSKAAEYGSVSEARAGQVTNGQQQVALGARARPEAQHDVDPMEDLRQIAHAVARPVLAFGACPT
jgi:hypothetical protein